MTPYFKLIITGFLICFVSCKNETNNKLTLAAKKKSEDYTPKKTEKKLSVSDTQQLYYYSSANNRKFDRRVTGLDENGNKVNGVINLENEIAIGILKGNNNSEIEIISDKINDNQIIATDINGFEYKLKID